MVGTMFFCAVLYSLRCSIWYGVQSSIGGSCVLVMLRAIWPSVNNIREFNDELVLRNLIYCTTKQIPCRCHLALTPGISCASSFFG